MTAAGVIESVDVSERALVRHWFKNNGRAQSRSADGLPASPPYQLGLDRFEEFLHSGIVITISFADHCHLKTVFAQDFLIVVRTLSAAPVDVEDAAARRRSQGDGHFQCPDCQVAFDAVADSPAYDPPGMQVEERAIGECPVFCVTGIWSMLSERSKDDDNFQGTAGRTAEGLRAT